MRLDIPEFSVDIRVRLCIRRATYVERASAYEHTDI